MSSLNENINQFKRNKLNQYIKHIGNVNFHPFIALMGPIHKFYRNFSMKILTKREW